MREDDFYDAAIEKGVALVVLTPIIASMGGKSGMQTLMVVVRALAVRELTAANALWITGKETFVGGIEGILFVIVIGVVATVWFEEQIIEVIIGAAMLINLFLVGVAGTVIPLGLDRLGC